MSCRPWALRATRGLWIQVHGWCCLMRGGATLRLPGLLSALGPARHACMQDPEAAAVVMSRWSSTPGACPCYLVDWQACLAHLLPWHVMEAIQALPTQRAAFFAGQVRSGGCCAFRAQDCTPPKGVGGLVLACPGPVGEPRQQHADHRHQTPRVDYGGAPVRLI